MSNTAAMIESAPAVNGTTPPRKQTDGTPYVYAERQRLPDERPSVTHRFSVGGHKGYITVGLYPDGRPGELFITMAKEGSSVSGFVNSFAQAISIALQHAVPLEVFCDKFLHTKFEPSGFTGNPEIPIASSIMDYISRWLRLRFFGKRDVEPSVAWEPVAVSTATKADMCPGQNGEVPTDAPLCRQCGELTRRNGACFVCVNCGASTGCG